MLRLLCRLSPPQSEPELLATALEEAEPAILAVALTRWAVIGQLVAILASDWSDDHNTRLWLVQVYARAAGGGAAGRHTGEPQGCPHLRQEEVDSGDSEES